MMLKYLNEDPDAPASGSEENGTELENSRIMYVSATANQPVYLTYSTSAQHQTLGEYYNGQQVTVLSTMENWAYVRVDDKTGYMLTEYLRDSFSKPSGTETVIATLYVCVKDGLLKLRKSPGTSSTIIAKYSNDAPESVHAYTNSTWARVTVKGQTGYMMREYLTSTVPTARRARPPAAKGPNPAHPLKTILPPPPRWLSKRATMANCTCAGPQAPAPYRWANTQTARK